MTTGKSIVTIIAYGMLIIGIGVLLWLIVHRLFFLPAENAANQTRVVTNEETAIATGEAAGDALETVREVHTEYHRIDRITERNENEIRNADDVGAALERSLCRRTAYHSDPRCAAMLADDRGVGVAGSDDRRTAP